MNYANMKIYFDGGHYVGIPQGAFPSGKGCKRRAVKPMKQQSTAEAMLIPVRWRSSFPQSFLTQEVRSSVTIRSLKSIGCAYTPKTTT